MNYQPSDYLPVLIQIAFAVGFVVLTMIVSPLLGPRLNSKKKDDVFECGIESIGNARAPLSIKYFLVAILFVLFDVEIVFMYPWATNFKTLGWEGLGAVGLFLGLFLAAFYYVYKKGVLTWD